MLDRSDVWKAKIDRQCVRWSAANGATHLVMLRYDSYDNCGERSRDRPTVSCLWSVGKTRKLVVEDSKVDAADRVPLLLTDLDRDGKPEIFFRGITNIVLGVMKIEGSNL